MRQQELQNEEERMLKRNEMSISNGNVTLADVEYSSNAGNLHWIAGYFLFMSGSGCLNDCFAFVVAASSSSVVEGEEIVTSQDSCVTPIIRPLPAARSNRSVSLSNLCSFKDILMFSHM